MIFDKLWKCRRVRKRIERAYRKDMLKAKTANERASIGQEEWFELSMIDAEIQGEITRRLSKEARALDIPIPSGNCWVACDKTGINYWNEETRYNVAQQIRKEKKERRDYNLGLWKDILLLLTGIAAIASSLWSVLKR